MYPQLHGEMDEFMYKLGLLKKAHRILPPRYWNSVKVIDFKNPAFEKTPYVAGTWKLKRWLQGSAQPYKWILENPGKRKGGSDAVWDEIRASEKKAGMQGRYPSPSGLQYRNTNDLEVHGGLDLFAKKNTPVYAALPGKVRFVADEAAGEHPDRNRPGRKAIRSSYGYVVVLEHNVEGKNFFSLYGHLSGKTMKKLHENQKIRAGQRIGWMGTPKENGGWQPHTHFMIISKKEDATFGNLSGGVTYDELKAHPDDKEGVFHRFPNPALLFPHEKWFNEVEKMSHFRPNHPRPPNRWKR